MLEPADMARYEREVTAMLRRAGSDDPEAFSFVVRLLENAVFTGLPLAAQDLRAQGYSYQNIADALGVTQWAANKRFGRPTVVAELPG